MVPVPAGATETATGKPSVPLIVGITAVVLIGLAAGFVAMRKSRQAPLQQTPGLSLSDSGVTRRQTPDSLVLGTNPLMTGTATGLKVATSSGGAEFGNYRLERIIGQGGMGTTFLASRTRDDFPVVVKVPHDHLLAKPEFVNRFLLEGSLGATLHHPGIIRIYEAGEFQGCPFIAMELVEGTPLEKILENGQRLPLRRALEVTRDLALALDYAHMKGVVHRDLKPDNIMILTTGHAKLMDYGIARLLGSEGLTATGIYVGTPLYSAPESLRPGEVDTQSDLYSLGIILYRMLSGTLPFVSSNPLEVLRQHSSEPLPPFPPETEPPDDVRLLVERLTAKRKEDRYKTAELFLRDLDAVLNKGTG
jgi:serine/threonine-protein kinase